MNRKQIAIILFINIFIAMGFFVENLGVGFSELSTDSQNAIPVCYKIDDPTLFQNDLYLNDLENVKYYTPFYIDTIRFLAKCTHGDYVLAINVFSTILHLVYGLFWFYLFFLYFDKNFWVSFLLSIIIRGIVWLPGYEIWGISDLWTMMPRTFYAAFLPLPFILLHFRTKITYLFACFLIGFILNFHPITGIGGLILFVFLVISYFILIPQKSISYKIIFLGFITILVGLMPFVLVYFSKTDTALDYSLSEYKLAFRYRIPEFFENPIKYFTTWLKPKILFYFIPLIGYFVYTFFYKKNDLKKAQILIILSFFTLLIPTLTVYLEQFVNTVFEKNIRMSFQIIRAQKAAILPGFFALGFLVVEVSKKIKFFPQLTCLFIFLIAISKLAFFDSIPFFSDDISRTIFPNFNQIILSKNEKLTDIDKMSEFIKANTNKNEVFFNDYILRCSASRSVILDGKGASMLIEGNPKQLINWYKDLQELKAKQNYNDSLQFLKQKGANYLISDKILQDTLVKFIHNEGKLNLYKLN